MYQMNNSKAYIKMIFSIFGDTFNPIDFTKFIGIDPTVFWLKESEISERKGLLRKESSWNYTIESIDTLFFEDVAKLYLEKFESKFEDIVKYVDENKLEVKIYIIVEMGEDETPALYFNKFFLGVINRLNAEIDIDIYR